MPFLSVVTRCYKRPSMLEKNIASLQMQMDMDFEHLFLIDDDGHGLSWANRQFYRHRDKPHGDYILMLDDDDVLIRDDVVTQFKRKTTDYPELVMCKFDCGPWGVLPSHGVWVNKRPKLTRVGTSCFITRRDVWHSHIEHFGQPTAGDYHFLSAIWPDLTDIEWLDLVIGRIQQIGKGKPEADAR